MLRPHHFLLTGLLLVVNAAYADGFTPVAANDTTFGQQHQAIRRALSDGKTYSELDARQRGDVLAALDRIAAALAKPGGLDALSEADKIQVFNDQELVNTLLSNAYEDSRLVCERVRTTGSHRQTSQCFTVAERRRIREQSQEALRRNMSGQSLKSN